jgi:transposase
MSLYAKRLERSVHLAVAGRRAGRDHAAQLAYMLDDIDWRNPVRTGRPEAAG